ncbi:MAG: type II secretion system protein GspL [Pseudomonadota bacterium]
MPTLFVRALSTATPNEDGFSLGCEWLILEADGSQRSSGVADYRGLEDLLDQRFDWLADPANTVLIVPSEYVLGVSCRVPGRNLSQIRRALPFAVEEFVATDIGGMHLAHGAIQKDEAVRCNLVERQLLEQWRDCFVSLGVTPGAIVSEAELLPDEAGVVYVLLDGEQVLIKTSDQAATVDRINLGFAVQSVAENRLRIVNGSLTREERQELLDETDLVIDPEDGDNDSTLGFLANRWRGAGASAINLLQGEFAVRQPRQQGWQRWRSVGALAGCWFVIAVLVGVAQAFWADREADRLSAEGLSEYRKLFPDDRRVTATNWRRRLQNRVGASGSVEGVSLLLYINDLSQVIEPAMTLNGVNYNSVRSELTVDLLTPDFNRLDRVKGALEQRGHGVEVLSAQQQDNNQVRARLRVTAAT